MHHPVERALLFLIPLALACAEPPAEDEASTPDEPAAEAMSPPGAVAADPGHYAVEFENDAVRLLRVSYGAGEASVMHHHPAHCAVSFGPAAWEMELPDGSTVEELTEAGEIGCFEAGDHIPRNTGEEAAELILVETKEGAQPGPGAASEYPDAPTADPDHYSVAFENEVLRVLDINYGAGETSVMHHHPANCVVFLDYQPTTMEMPSGEVVEGAEDVERGTVACNDSEEHLPTNVGEGTTHVVVIELKGRESFAG